jgi:hypothetical protein
VTSTGARVMLVDDDNDASSSSLNIKSTTSSRMGAHRSLSDAAAALKCRAYDRSGLLVGDIGKKNVVKIECLGGKRGWSSMRRSSWRDLIRES